MNRLKVFFLFLHGERLYGLGEILIPACGHIGFRIIGEILLDDIVLLVPGKFLPEGKGKYPVALS